MSAPHGRLALQRVRCICAIHSFLREIRAGFLEVAKDVADETKILDAGVAAEGNR